jgi:hypothetical protein
MRTIGYTTTRVWAFSYFYDKFNKDPRRLARADKLVEAGLLGGVVAGIASNPFEIVFARMQADDLYPERARRNYKGFLDGLQKVMEEKSLFRGSIANGLRVGALCASMTSIFDLCKENSYFFFGPHYINRLFGTVIAALLGIVVSTPFDMVRIRLYTMRPLPNGMHPYTGTFDCLTKVISF